MSAQEVFVEQFARLFHHYQEALSPGRGQVDEPGAGIETAAHASDRMVAAARLALLEMEDVAGVEGISHKYFATPGEAEWGC